MIGRQREPVWDFQTGDTKKQQDVLSPYTQKKAIQIATSQPPIQQLKADHKVTFLPQIKESSSAISGEDQLEAWPTANTRRSNSSFSTWSETPAFCLEIQMQAGKTDGPSKSKRLSLGQDYDSSPRDAGTAKNVGTEELVGATHRNPLLSRDALKLGMRKSFCSLKKHQQRPPGAQQHPINQAAHKGPKN